MKDFSANKDENEPVNFFLGFSASGLRAWRVTRGWVGEGARHAAASFDVPVFCSIPARVSDEVKNARARQIETERVKAFVHDLITAKSALGAPLSVEQLGEQVDACFGVDGLALKLGFKDVSFLVATGDRYKFVVDGDQTIVRDVLAEAPLSGGVLRQAERLRGQIFRRRPEEQWGLLLDDNDRVRFFAQQFVRQGHWKRLQQGSVVDFKPDVGARGDTAVDVQFIQHGDVRKLVQAKCLTFITEAAEKGERINKSELVNKLYELFNGPIPGVTSDAVGGLEALLSEVDGISFGGEGSTRVVSINESRAIGRLREGSRYSGFYDPGAKPSTKASVPKAAKAVHGSTLVHSGESLAPAEVSRRVLEILRGEPSGRLEITTLGERLKKYFPVEGRLAAHLGVKTLRAFLEGIEGVEVSGVPPRLWIELRKRVARRSDKGDSHLRRTSNGADRLVAGDLIVRLLSDAPGRALSIQALGAKLKPHYPRGPLAKQLGAGTFLEYLKSLNTVEIRGVAPSLTVALAVDEETPILDSE